MYNIQVKRPYVVDLLGTGPFFSCFIVHSGLHGVTHHDRLEVPNCLGLAISGVKGKFR